MNNSTTGTNHVHLYTGVSILFVVLATSINITGETKARLLRRIISINIPPPSSQPRLYDGVTSYLLHKGKIQHTVLSTLLAVDKKRIEKNQKDLWG